MHPSKEFQASSHRDVHLPRWSGLHCVVLDCLEADHSVEDVSSVSVDETPFPRRVYLLHHCVCSPLGWEPASGDVNPVFMIRFLVNVPTAVICYLQLDPIKFILFGLPAALTTVVCTLSTPSPSTYTGPRSHILFEDCFVSCSSSSVELLGRETSSIVSRSMLLFYLPNSY